MIIINDMVKGRTIAGMVDLFLMNIKDSYIALKRQYIPQYSTRKITIKKMSNSIMSGIAPYSIPLMISTMLYKMKPIINFFISITSYMNYLVLHALKNCSINQNQTHKGSTVIKISSQGFINPSVSSTTTKYTHDEMNMSKAKNNFFISITSYIYDKKEIKLETIDSMRER